MKTSLRRTTSKEKKEPKVGQDEADEIFDGLDEVRERLDKAFETEKSKAIPKKEDQPIKRRDSVKQELGGGGSYVRMQS